MTPSGGELASPRVVAIVPARDEVATVAANVAAAAGCRYVAEVVVVDDGSTDGTAEAAAAAGARVVRLDGSAGSKALALRAGVDAAPDAEVLLFVDADCTDLTAAHLDAVVEPVIDERCELSLGSFDYGPFWNPMVLRWPPLTGERCMPRWVFDAVPAAKFDGYTIEVRINEVIAEGHLRTVTRTMRGVYHRTKREKFGRDEGSRRTWLMYKALLSMLVPIGDVRWRTYPFYLRGLTVEAPVGDTPRQR